jgi:hypothetical protein
LGDPVVDRYLEFVGGRCRPNTLRAVRHHVEIGDLRNATLYERCVVGLPDMAMPEVAPTAVAGDEVCARVDQGGDEAGFARPGPACIERALEPLDLGHLESRD